MPLKLRICTYATLLRLLDRTATIQGPEPMYELMLITGQTRNSSSVDLIVYKS